ncbi:MAG: amidohydrolase [Thermoanaerobaculia bacterium]|nr:amidohydrolase [Thermoanaerobaculia bacterium]
MTRFAGSLLAALLLTACTSPASEETTTSSADLVLTGGHVVTVAGPMPTAQAVAVSGHRIVAVGSDEEIAAFVGPNTQVIELAGRTLIPGLIEGHGHFYGLGTAMRQVAAGQPSTWEGIVALVEKAVTESGPGVWIEGRGWHQDKWDHVPEPSVEGYPVHDALSAISPDNPVVLRHASGHGAFANAKAMELGGITDETPAPPGGKIVRDSKGHATGVFIETAQGLISRKDSPSPEEVALRLEAADKESTSNGITSFQDAGSSLGEIPFLRQAAEEGALDVRLWVMIRDEPEAILAALPDVKVKGLADDHFTVGGIKVSLDGALGSRGAWLLEPYSDQPDTSGLETTPLAVVAANAEVARDHDLQLCVHAIGDRANRETLDVFAAALDGTDRASERRWRIEHAQNVHPDDVHRFADLGVIAAIQSVHCTSDGPWVPERLGAERSAERAYVWRDLINAGVALMNGTDTPVEDIDPIANYYSAVTRRMNNGETFTPDQVLTREEALRSMTLDAAYGAFEEDIKGSIEVGKLADFVVLSQDLLTVPEEAITNTEVEMTIIGGEVVYQK